MKTMKYRSIFAAFTAVALSVFLFTSCEKESGDAEIYKPNRLEKFKRLKFTSGSASTSTNSGTGTFIGNGSSSISYVPPGDGGSAQFAPVSAGNNNGFTNPNSAGPNFVVERSFGQGGGSVTIDGDRYDMDFAFCAEADFFGFFGDEGDSTSNDGDGPDLNMFIGIAGNFSFDSLSNSDLGLDLILYVFSYNGGATVGTFDDFEDDLSDNFKGAFIIGVAFEEDENGDKQEAFYFGTQGSVAFAGEEVLMSGVKLAKVELGSNSNSLTNEEVNMSADLTCVGVPDGALPQ